MFGAMTHGYVHLPIGRQPFRELHFPGRSMSLDMSFPLRNQVFIAGGATIRRAGHHGDHDAGRGDAQNR